MGTNVFKTSVWIYVGLGAAREISTVAQAYAFLDDWPVHRRTLAHRLAVHACKGALLGEIDAETARSAFAAFALCADIAAPDLEAAVTSYAARQFARRAAVP